MWIAQREAGAQVETWKGRRRGGDVVSDGWPAMDSFGRRGNLNDVLTRWRESRWDRLIASGDRGWGLRVARMRTNGVGGGNEGGSRNQSWAKLCSVDAVGGDSLDKGLRCRRNGPRRGRLSWLIFLPGGGELVGVRGNEGDSHDEGLDVSENVGALGVPGVGYLAHGRVLVGVHGLLELGYFVAPHRCGLRCGRRCIVGGQGIGCVRARNSLCKIWGLCT